MSSLIRRDLAWMDTAPVVAEHTQELPASASKVFAVIADHERWPEWFPRITKVELAGGPAGVGGRRRVHVKKMVFDEVFIGWEDDRLFAFTVTDCSRKLVSSLAEAVRIEPLDEDRCRVRYTMAIEPRRGWGWLTRRIVLRQMPKNLGTALTRLGERAAR